MALTDKDIDAAAFYHLGVPQAEDFNREDQRRREFARAVEALTREDERERAVSAMNSLQNEFLLSLAGVRKEILGTDGPHALTDNPPLKWQPIDTAPMDGTKILICLAHDEDGNPITGGDFGLFVHRAAWWVDEGWIVYNSLETERPAFFTPTHWMPIPPPIFDCN